jgi:hypothetical protein
LNSLERPDMNYLLCPLRRIGPDEAALLTPGKVIRVGRDPDNHLRLTSVSVSRFHLEVVHFGSVVRVQDVGSRCGFKINGDRQPEEAALASGDRLHVGKELLCLFPAPDIDPAWLLWQGGTVPRIARRIHDRQECSDLPLLADALEDAGCIDPELLGHMRRHGPLVRRCWAVELVLGES